MMTNMILTAETLASREHQHPTPTLLIYGAAIRNRANSPGFTNMQFSNRQLNDGLSIMSLGLLEKIRRRGPLTGLDDLPPVHPPVARSPRVDLPWRKFLIATFTNSKFESSHCKHARYQNSNRNKNRSSGNVARLFRPEAFRRSSFVTSVLIHHPDLLLAAPRGCVCNLPGIGRKTRIVIPILIRGYLRHFVRTQIAEKDIVIGEVPGQDDTLKFKPLGADTIETEPSSMLIVMRDL